MMANQGDNNNQIQGDNNIQQQNNNQAQINRDGSTGIQVRANGGTNNIAKEITQYNIVVYQNGGDGASAPKEYNFQRYLSSVVEKYQQWSSFYTLTKNSNKKYIHLFMYLQSTLVDFIYEPGEQCVAGVSPVVATAVV